MQNFILNPICSYRHELRNSPLMEIYDKKRQLTIILRLYFYSFKYFCSFIRSNVRSKCSTLPRAHNIHVYDSLRLLAHHVHHNPKKCCQVLIDHQIFNSHKLSTELWRLKVLHVDVKENSDADCNVLHQHPTERVVHCWFQLFLPREIKPKFSAKLSKYHLFTYDKHMDFSIDMWENIRCFPKFTYVNTR